MPRHRTTPLLRSLLLVLVMGWMDLACPQLCPEYVPRFSSDYNRCGNLSQNAPCSVSCIPSSSRILEFRCDNGTWASTSSSLPSSCDEICSKCDCSRMPMIKCSVDQGMELELQGLPKNVAQLSFKGTNQFLPSALPFTLTNRSFLTN